MKLHHSPQTRSLRAVWMLEELEVPFEIVTVPVLSGAGRTPEYRAIHPHGYVPAFEDDDGTRLIESAAIVLHLADKYPEKKLAPAIGTADRAKYYQWSIYAPATVDPLLEAIMFNTLFLPEPKRDPALVTRSKKRFATCAEVISNALSDRPYLLGSFSAADVIVGMDMGWARLCGILDEYPALVAYANRLAERPAFQRALSR